MRFETDPFWDPKQHYGDGGISPEDRRDRAQLIEDPNFISAGNSPIFIENNVNKNSIQTVMPLPVHIERLEE